MRAALLALAVLAAACAGEEGGSPPAAEGAAEGGATGRVGRPELVEALRADVAAPRHPADGAGRAWLDAAEPATVSTPGSWTVVYEAGPLGVAAGGAVYLQVSPFWGWSTPQVDDPLAPGYTEVTTDAAGVELAPRTLDRQLLTVAIQGRPLAAGERLRFAYGAGPAGAVADRYAEEASRFWIAVDGDGDGVRGLVVGSPGVDVRPGPPARLLAFLPSTARPGEAVPLVLSVVDAVGNGGVDFTGTVRLVDLPAGVTAPASVAFTAADAGSVRVEVTAADAGVVRLRAVGPDRLEASTNPMQVAAAGARVLWGDLQNHSALSDGTAQLEGFFRYARDVAALDVVALTDHDHWGLRFLDASPDLWEATLEANARWHEPGRFVTVPGFEWTSWIHGHRHVLFFDGDPQVLSSLDEGLDEPRELWAALAGRRALTLAHHSAGGPIATDWSIAPDAALEPVTEVVSVHGASEAPDAPTPIYSPVVGNFVRDALARGYRLGFLGSSDGHDGHPGLGHLASPSGGLAAILAEEATRDAVYDALRERRVYATNGPRILLRVSWGGYRMGELVPLDRDEEGEGAWRARPAPAPVPGIPPGTLVAQAMAPAPIERVDVVHGGRGREATVESLACDAELDCALGAVVDAVAPGDYLYVRVVQEDGGAAWSSPFFFARGSGDEKGPGR